MNGPGGIKRGGPTEHLVLIGAKQAKTYREIIYPLSRGGDVKFLLPQMKELDKGGVSREGAIELGPDPKLTVKIPVTKGALFRFNQQMETYNNFLARQKSSVKLAETLEAMQKYIDCLVLLGQIVTLLHLDEPASISRPEAKPIIKAVLEEVSFRKHNLESLIAPEEMTYPFRMEEQMKKLLRINS